MVLVTISGRKNNILEKQEDSVGTLVRDVSKHDILKGPFKMLNICSCFALCIVASKLSPLFMNLYLHYNIVGPKRIEENISGMATME
jgi:hypothetical protein